MLYTEQGDLAIDNNLSERTLRQLVVGRANRQFCGSGEGGRTAAALYSVVGTCKHRGIDPFTYFGEALAALFGLGESPGEEALAYWLPDAWQQWRRTEELANAARPAAGESYPAAEQIGKVTARRVRCPTCRSIMA
jgi:hypothetical protein